MVETMRPLVLMLSMEAQAVVVALEHPQGLRRLVEVLFLPQAEVVVVVILLVLTAAQAAGVEVGGQ